MRRYLAVAARGIIVLPDLDGVGLGTEMEGQVVRMATQRPTRLTSQMRSISRAMARANAYRFSNTLQ
jgi:hypothetical protein